MGKRKHSDGGRPGGVGRPRGVLGGNERACTRKVAMDKKAAVKQAKNARRRTGGEPIYPYLCEGCGAWHIGHSKVVEERMRGGGDE